MAHEGVSLEPEPGDLTPVVGSQGDIAPLGRDMAKPPHEQTADEDVNVVNWDQVAATDEFRALVAAKIRFILPATIFFLVFYMALPLLVGYAPDLMKTQVIGEVNLAYLFALAQFLMTFILAYLYLRKANQFDAMAQNIISRLSIKRGGAK